MSLNVANCDRCGKIYMKNNYGLCPNCLREMEKQYETCLKYLRENRACSILELSDATEVPVKQIVKFIREGRISIKSNPNMTYECDVCGAQIREHNMCDACRARLTKEARNMAEDEQRKKQNAEQAKHVSFLIKDRLQDRTK
ncbi:flagellar protein [Paenibacillus elgii]|uniref:flagellar protein n=1 Tax=Paenibacillus elgii TaxID=189691 RepID=UPI000248C66E|nr:flagellar protein [Paenibacillus elgii]